MKVKVKKTKNHLQHGMAYRTDTMGKSTFLVRNKFNTSGRAESFQLLAFIPPNRNAYFRKQMLTLLIILGSIPISYAQFGENHAIYTVGEIQLGNFIGIDMNLNYVYKEKYAFKIGYLGNLSVSKANPEIYPPGYYGLPLLGILRPLDRIETYQIAFGRMYPLNKSGTIRANLALGVGYSTLREPDAYSDVSHSWNYNKYHSVSFIVNPKIEFPFSRYYGLTFSTMVHLSKDNTYFGIGIGHMMGLLRKKRIN